MRWNIRSLYFGFAAVVITLLYSNCGAYKVDPVLNGGAGSFSSLSCEAVAIRAFAGGFHPFLKQNCASCHAGGVGKGSFAAINPNTAWDSFAHAGSAKVAEYATTAHQPPFTGSQHAATVATLKANYDTAHASYEACKSGTVDTPEPVTPRLVTLAKPINGGERTTTVTWDLASEWQEDEEVSFPGAQLTVNVVTSKSPTDKTSYQFSNLRLKGASDSALHIEDLRILINGIEVLSGTTWVTVNRNVPANGVRQISPGVLIVERPLSAEDTIAFSIRKLEPTTFNPPTLTQLRAATGVFGASCIACHDATMASGGLNLQNYNSTLARLIEFDAENSLLWKRMSDSNAPMPPPGSGGLLPQSDVDKVRDWILDGALNN